MLLKVAGHPHGMAAPLGHRFIDRVTMVGAPHRIIIVHGEGAVEVLGDLIIMTLELGYIQSVFFVTVYLNI